MEFLRNAVAGVWGLLKPATTASNTVIAATETTEKDIDLVIEKRSGLIYSTAAETLARDGNTAAITAAITAAVTTDQELSKLKGRINETVVQIRGVRGKNQEQAQPEEMVKLDAIDGKIDILVIANDTAAVANNNNAIASNKLSNDLDTARGLVLYDLTVPISPAQARQAVLAQAAQEAFNQALRRTGSQDIAQAAQAVLNQVLAQNLYGDITQAIQATQAAQVVIFNQVFALTGNRETAEVAAVAVVKEAVAAAQAAAASPEVAERARQADLVARPAFEEAQAAPQAIASITPDSLTTMGNISIKAIKDNNIQYQAYDELYRQKYECLPDVVFEYNVADKENLRALRAKLSTDRISTLQFRDSCVAESAEQLAGILKQYNGWSIADPVTTRVSQLMMSRCTESWTP